MNEMRPYLRLVDGTVDEMNTQQRFPDTFEDEAGFVVGRQKSTDAPEKLGLQDKHREAAEAHLTTNGFSGNHARIFSEISGDTTRRWFIENISGKPLVVNGTTVRENDVVALVDKMIISFGKDDRKAYQFCLTPHEAEKQLPSTHGVSLAGVSEAEATATIEVGQLRSLQQSVEASGRITEATNEIRQLFAREEDARVIYDGLKEILRKAIPGESGEKVERILFIGKEEGDQFRVVNAGIDPGQDKNFSSTRVRQVIDEQTAMCVPFNGADATATMAAMSQEHGMIAPIVNRSGEYIGAIQVDGKEEFTQEELQIMSILGPMLQLYLESQRTKSAEEQLAYAEKQADELSRIGEYFYDNSVTPEAAYEAPGITGHLYYKACNDMEGRHSNIGGDYVDRIPLADGRIMIISGDVMGHGPKAAPVTKWACMTMRQYAADIPAENSVTAGDALNHLNRSLADCSLAEGKMMTGCITIINPTNRTASFANAGHDPTFVKVGNELRVLGDHGVAGHLGLESIGDNVTGTILNLSGDIEFESTELELPEGAMVISYSDGLPESWDRPPTEDGAKQFEMERLVIQLRDAPDDPQQVCGTVMDAVHTFQAGTQKDDESIIATKVA